ncbi:MAG: polyribonucleotide nucleotidyltransferase [Chloroflexota bacterium]|nr:MAG: polyribonucleotide nucleotidyltransferase [Chloroflexota bacterium]
MVHRVESTIGGQVLSLETGKLAGLADGAVMVRYGDTIVLVTAVMSAQPRPGIDFLPLTVDYEERLYAAGKIPGGFIKREGRPSQDAVLAGRLTDRSIRPLFPKGLRNDVQIVITVLSADQENDPDLLAIVGASAALSISDIPFDGPIAATRIGHIDGQLVVNPTGTQLTQSKLDLVVSGTRDAVVMVEAGAREVPEETVLEAIQLAQETNQQAIETQLQLAEAAGRPKREVALEVLNPEVEQWVRERAGDRITEAIYQTDKSVREESAAALQRDLVAQAEGIYTEKEVLAGYTAVSKKVVRAGILQESRRPDGRDTTTIRPISCEVGILPRTHGSGLFTRGQTQVLTIATLGSTGDEQIIDGLGLEESKRFLHHYNFPPFSVGETGRLGTPSRRSIGHGALAERAISAVIPSQDQFPYTIRLVSEVLSSNGSTSMGSVCGSTLSLMDAGVPIKAPVAGVAMGLIAGEEGRYAVLTDIQGIEDALGDMDFKVAGTAEGITALQMDIKVRGITPEVLRQALSQAREGRLFILGKMMEAISEPRTEVSPYAPRMYKISINPEKIGKVIGTGGKTIRGLIDEYKVTIDVEDDGTVIIGSSNDENARRAIRAVEGLTKEAEVGQIYTGKVTRLMNFGAFVEILPGKEGLVHISELADYHVNRVEDVVQVGDEITVMVTEIDRMGRVNLSRKAAFTGQRPAPSAGRPDGDRGPQRREEGRGGPRGGGMGGGSRLNPHRPTHEGRQREQRSGPPGGGMPFKRHP